MLRMGPRPVKRRMNCNPMLLAPVRSRLCGSLQSSLWSTVRRALAGFAQPSSETRRYWQGSAVRCSTMSCTRVRSCQMFSRRRIRTHTLASCTHGRSMCGGLPSTSGIWKRIASGSERGALSDHWPLSSMLRMRVGTVDRFHSVPHMNRVCTHTCRHLVRAPRAHIGCTALRFA